MFVYSKTMFLNFNSNPYFGSIILNPNKSGNFVLSTIIKSFKIYQLFAVREYIYFYLIVLKSLLF